MAHPLRLRQVAFSNRAASFRCAWRGGAPGASGVGVGDVVGAYVSHLQFHCCAVLL
jgi:hypothetical protein